MKGLRLLLFLAGFHLVHPQSFLSAISAYPQLSDFTKLMKLNSTLADSLLHTSVVGGEQTILVPSNAAFTKYQQTTGQPFESSGPKNIQTTLQYHTLNASLTSAILAQKPDIVLSTQLTDPKYNLIGSTANTNLNVEGQVLYITSRGSPNTSSTASVGSGLGSIGDMHVVDGTWSGGKFQIVDSFLTLPALCTNTLSAIGLSSMLTSVNRTNSTDEWDGHPGLTCLSPSNEAFGNAGSPQIISSEDALNDVLDHHTIDSAQYTSGLRDGQVLQSEAGTPILVTIKDGTVYFNNAKVIRANVVTKNGVIHVLDSFISNNTNITATASPTESPTASSTASGNAGSTVKSNMLLRASLSISLISQICCLALVFGCWL